MEKIDIKIVGLDDDEVIRMWIDEVIPRIPLETENLFRVEGGTYEDPEEFDKHFDDKAQIVILDHHLNGSLTGLDVMKKILEKNIACHVIVITGNSNPQLIIDYYDHGAFRVQIKNDKDFKERLESNIQDAFEKLENSIRTYRRAWESIQNLKKEDAAI